MDNIVIGLGGAMAGTGVTSFIWSFNIIPQSITLPVVCVGALAGFVLGYWVSCKAKQK